MIEHQFNVSIFWELTKYLSRETDYVVWYPMIEVFEYMSTILPFPSYVNIKAMINKYYLTKNVNIILFNNINKCKLFINGDELLKY